VRPKRAEPIPASRSEPQTCPRSPPYERRHPLALSGGRFARDQVRLGVIAPVASSSSITAALKTVDPKHGIRSAQRNLLRLG
jgi:hypothetical protein